jgi:hypothetical protein
VREEVRERKRGDWKALRKEKERNGNKNKALH